MSLVAFAAVKIDAIESLNDAMDRCSLPDASPVEAAHAAGVDVDVERDNRIGSEEYDGRKIDSECKQRHAQPYAINRCGREYGGHNRFDRRDRL